MDEHDIFNIEDDQAKKSMPFEKKYLIGVTIIAVILVIAMTIIGMYVGYVAARKDNATIIETNPTINIMGTDNTKVGVQDVVREVENSVVQVTSESPASVSRGSGVILSADGYIVTNAHVVSNASVSADIKIALANGKVYTARKFMKDDIMDIAVIKIETGEELIPAKLGLETDLNKGEHVVVIGNPLGTLGGSVTDGILSALDRDIVVGDRPMRLIQTNAEINPGNSGGGMFNMNGELIGIVNAKNTATEVEGIGFAIPIKDAYKVVYDLITVGYVRGRIDTGIITVNIQNFFDFIYYFGSAVPYDGTPGVYIYKTKDDVFKSGDKIVAVDGVIVNSLSEYNIVLDKYAVGDKVKFTIMRAGEKENITVTLKEFTNESD